jgi:hypothetical protein
MGCLVARALLLGYTETMEKIRRHKEERHLYERGFSCLKGIVSTVRVNGKMGGGDAGVA